ncbi:protein-methionine-sulfoxide reductase heme-binding subunit MsrQ [Profundibacterium mesophilum]|uniref:Protein-methionine-sulfoxide reductase heme-binding subunit MsrQ n=1 Tax=Profundibacterium mesophilum KAUST100406-0324 TaxID=1037889 RepID=A0A921NVV4_9RHOB|nr:protein-methionine-sulfoxide reductase heme-binding subunit MsrQ [Profundibacterium mesophilum]KAF0674513.1 Sulfoxide reductase heme-binding subunit YedZ [Profundibacterium mesophilum KAUST100406-0324]
MALAATVNGAVRRIPVWAVYALGVLPPVWYFYLGLTGGLGVEPIKALEQKIGLLALQMLIAVLAVTPLMRLTRINLMKFRRALGVLTFYYVTCHLLAWLVLDIQDPARIWADILKRPYITVGMAGFALLLPLAITSNNLSLRKLGPLRWRRLHKLTYVAALLGAVHYVMLAKGLQLEPLIYLAIITGLLALRLPMMRRARTA